MSRLRRRWRWFNIGGPRITIAGHSVRLWNCFNRHTNDGEHWWGVGVIQVGRRHLFCLAHSGKSIFFLGKTE